MNDIRFRNRSTQLPDRPVRRYAGAAIRREAAAPIPLFMREDLTPFSKPIHPKQSIKSFFWLVAAALLWVVIIFKINHYMDHYYKLHKAQMQEKQILLEDN